MKKQICILLMIISLLTISIPLSASAQTYDAPQISVEYLDNGYYYETIISSQENDINITPSSTTKYITKTKTTNLKNAAGVTQWSVSIKATFSYNGSSSKCTSCTPSAKAYGSTWSIKSVTSNKSGNTATATAKATQTGASGLSQTYTKSVTIKCSATGVIS